MILNSYSMSDVSDIEANIQTSVEQTSVDQTCIENSSKQKTSYEDTDSEIHKKQEILLQFLHNCGIVCNTYNELDHLVIPRDILICNKKYNSLQEYVALFKKHFSSSYLTSLQNTAGNKQRWPVLNFVRQILKAYNFKLTPKRLCDGYTKEKKKKYRRVFVIEKLKQID